MTKRKKVFYWIATVWLATDLLAGSLQQLFQTENFTNMFAHAGIFFTWSGAALSHIAIGDALIKIAHSLVLLVLTVISWYWRPENRKVIKLGMPIRS